MKGRNLQLTCWRINHLADLTSKRWITTPVQRLLIWASKLVLEAKSANQCWNRSRCQRRCIETNKWSWIQPISLVSMRRIRSIRTMPMRSILHTERPEMAIGLSSWEARSESMRDSGKDKGEVAVSLWCIKRIMKRHLKDCLIDSHRIQAARETWRRCLHWLRDIKSQKLPRTNRKAPKTLLSNQQGIPWFH